MLQEWQFESGSIWTHKKVESIFYRRSHRVYLKAGHLGLFAKKRESLISPKATTSKFP